MSAAPGSREQVLALLDELPPDRWPDVVRLLRSLVVENDVLRAQPEAEKIEAPPEEARLIESARRSLGPGDEARLRDLQSREEAGRLSNGDRAELRVLEGRADRIDMERTTALLKLARIRGVDVVEVVKDLGLRADGGHH